MYSAAGALTQAARASDADFLKADSENPFAHPLPVNPECPVPPSRVGGRGAPSGQKHLISTYQPGISRERCRRSQKAGDRDISR